MKKVINKVRRPEKSHVRRLEKTALARELGISRVTLDDFLNRTEPPPPKPDKRRAYSVDETARYIEANGFKAVSTAELQKLREVRMRMQTEDMEIDLGVKRGKYIAKEKIAPAIAAFCARLTEDMRMKFEQEIPPKMEGRTTLQRQEMLAAGVDWVLRRLKAGTAPLEK